MVARHVEVDAQRPPDLTRLDTILDGLGRGPAVEAGQHMIYQHRCAVRSAESQDNPVVELREPHASQHTQTHYPASASASWHTRTGSATPATLAHLLVSKYCDHLPLYRQSEIYGRDGVDLDRSTLCDWVGQAAWLLQPIVEGIQRHVFSAEKIHGDDTPVPVL